MGEFVLGEAIEKHTDALDAVADALQKGDRPAVTARLLELLGQVATEVPLVGKLLGRGVDAIFAGSANAVLTEQVEAWERQQERVVFRNELCDSVEVLIGQALLQLVRSHHSVKDELIEALGGLRADLADFRREIHTRIADAAIAVEIQTVEAGGSGVRVRDASRNRVFIKRMTVRGTGSTGMDLG